MNLKDAIAAYKARRDRLGVDVPGGTCIAEDHTGHGHASKQGCPANDGGNHCYAILEPDWFPRECINCGELESPHPSKKGK